MDRSVIIRLEETLVDIRRGLHDSSKIIRCYNSADDDNEDGKNDLKLENDDDDEEFDYLL